MRKPVWKLSVRSATRSVVKGLLVLAMCNAPAYAHRNLDIVSGATGNGSDLGWEASLDETNWFPISAPYPNPITAPNLNLNGVSIPDAGSSNAKLMWYLPPGGTADGMSGPTKVFFRYVFDLNSATLLGGGITNAWIAADDWMSVKVNGNEVGTYLLDDHKLPNGQPEPILINFTEFLNDILEGDPTSLNTILIEAHDGGVSPFDRAFEWVFFDAQANPLLGQGPTFVTPSAVPEPTALALLIAGFLGFGGIFGRGKSRNL